MPSGYRRWATSPSGTSLGELIPARQRLRLTGSRSTLLAHGCPVQPLDGPTSGGLRPRCPCDAVSAGVTPCRPATMLPPAEMRRGWSPTDSRARAQSPRDASALLPRWGLDDGSWLRLHQFLGRADDRRHQPGRPTRRVDLATKCGIGEVPKIPGQQVVDPRNSRDRDMHGIHACALRQHGRRRDCTKVPTRGPADSCGISLSAPRRRAAAVTSPRRASATTAAASRPRCCELRFVCHVSEMIGHRDRR